ncbi:cytochrome-c oxidase, cbb3-type subunit III [Methylocystis sp. WRRC1]|uniref:cytochrome-c oxidase, cbb3-type subunit III n=1 Tax=unclassified Methylocystis TaxID=2625913 RepID=UPI0001F86F23|nr:MULTISPECIES: cytochrome-c oxidase, cbb3-type subunit III [unclassified Methylocystis]MCC3246837.1 cytochrome-c oxidase, cbb3-type subunit III [Methylocystis sp. WRRC1]
MSQDAEHGKIRIDEHSGVPTTGHEWDGIEELNTPLPRWWVWTLWATIIWGIAYTVVYPAWPTFSGGTKGLFGWSSRDQVAQEMADLQETRGPILAKIKDASLEQIESNPELLAAARMVGKVAFATNCAACHGAGGQGAKGYANLNDDDWIWGGKLADIRQTIEHGVRWDADKATRTSAMPAFGRDGILTPEQISIVADHVRTYAETPDSDAPTAEGEKLYAENCAACHGVEGKGNPEMGAPALYDQVWLYGSDKPSIVARITNGGGGVMPAWKDKLDETTIKALTVYVHSLGGGQ